MEAIRLAALFVTLALSGHAATPVPVHRAHVAADAPAAYVGTGAWIDRYDYPHLRDPDAAVVEMADHGVRTLYLETASYKVSRRVDIVAPAQIDEWIDAAHRYGLQVVAWYLPGLADLRLDLRRVRAAIAYQAPDGDSFDGFALDIEANLVSPVRRRNAALLSLSRQIRALVGPSYALGAIVPDQLSTSRGNVLWPGFPFSAVARYYDVFLPIAYSTLNRARGAGRVYDYTAANVRYVRRATGRPVHVIGGLTDAMTGAEQGAVSLAALDSGAIGASLYKYRLYDAGSWAALSSFDTSVP